MPIRVHVHDSQGYRVLDTLDGVEKLVGVEGTNLWLDTTEHTPELARLLEGPAFGLHPLVLEDIFCDNQVPKVEDYGTYLYVVLHGPRRDAEQPENLGTIEVDVVLGKNWVFTHHSGELRSVDDMTVELKRNPRALMRGPAFLAHGIIDKLTDYFIPVLDRFQDEIDELETSTVHKPGHDVLPHIFLLKRSLQKLRRIAVYQREILQRLSRGEFECLPESSLVFYRDVYDHYVRISDLADSYRELVSAGLDIYLSVTANRTNEIMKVLAVISTVMLPLTFIAGVYGMNFERMPELKWIYGYPFALGLMAVVAVGFLLWFRRRGWL